MWGSTTPNTVDECTWANAPFNNHSSDYNETYFNSVKKTVCPNGVLAKEYDAASQIMGGDWRMPTKDDFQELLANTTVNTITINGTKVNKLISKTDNSKYIVIPVSNYGNIDVWSSSLSTSYSNCAYVLRFDSDEDIYANTGSNLRYKGIVVRGVRK